MAFLMTNSRFPGGVTKKCQKVRNILYCFKDWIRVDGSRSIQQFLNKFFHLLQNFNVKVSSQPREADIDCLRKSSKWLEDPWAENWKFESQFYSRRWHTAHGVWRLKRQRTTSSLIDKVSEISYAPHVICNLSPIFLPNDSLRCSTTGMYILNS